MVQSIMEYGYGGGWPLQDSGLPYNLATSREISELKPRESGRYLKVLLSPRMPEPPLTHRGMGAATPRAGLPQPLGARPIILRGSRSRRHQRG